VLPELSAIRELVRTAARELLLPHFAEVQRHIKMDGSVVTEVDHAMQDRLQRDLGKHWPDYDFLGEEMPARERMKLVELSGKGLWCVDPLDGTTNYAAGLPYFAVSLALLNRDGVAIGLVYDPVRDECFMAEKGRGAWLNEVPLGLPSTTPTPALGICIAVVDLKRLDVSLAQSLVSRRPFGSQRYFGASSLEWCWLADGRFHVYLHGGQQPWDYAGGSLILAEAGGQALTLEGEAIVSDVLMTRSVVAALHPTLFEDWKTWLQTQSSASN
jgi:myo-inositol-1(or 4)-monophosphatase